MKKEETLAEQINELYFCHPQLTAHKAQDEILEGLRLLQKVEKPIVTIYGSHKVEQDDSDFVLCQKVAKKLATNKFAIATGGGTGIMLAANSTAHIMGTDSIAFKGAPFVDEHVKSDFYTHELSFEFIFARRFILSIKSDALIFFPGGYGTLNELFEILVLMQSKIIEQVPVVLIREEYWKGLFDWMDTHLAQGGMLTNDHHDLGLVHFAENADDAVRIIQANRPKGGNQHCKLE